MRQFITRIIVELTHGVRISPRITRESKRVMPAGLLPATDASSAAAEMPDIDGYGPAASAPLAAKTPRTTHLVSRTMYYSTLV